MRRAQITLLIEYLPFMFEMIGLICLISAIWLLVGVIIALILASAVFISLGVVLELTGPQRE